jgi:hypothetical protein
MPNKYKYSSISLKTSTVSRLNTLAKELIPGIHLSSAKAVELMIDRVGSSEDEKGTFNAKDTKEII